jgi:hypothetical protein
MPGRRMPQISMPAMECYGSCKTSLNHSNSMANTVFLLSGAK